MAELCERAGITADFARQLEEFGLLAPRIEGGERLYARATPTSRSPARRSRGTGSTPGTCARSAPPPAASRRCSSRSSRRRSARATCERRTAALEDLETLAVVAQELAQLLLMRDLREVAER